MNFSTSGAFFVNELLYTNMRYYHGTLLKKHGTAQYSLKSMLVLFKALQRDLDEFLLDAVHK